MKNLLIIILFFSLILPDELFIWDGFESSGLETLDWSTEEEMGWQVDTTDPFDSLYSAHSNLNLADSETSSITLIADTGCQESSQISFYRKVSSEPDYDFLIFYINDIEQAEWSGLSDWQQFTFDLPQGQSTLRWEYNKDGSVSSNEDMVWIDNIEFIAYTPTVNIGDNYSVEFIHDGSPGGNLVLDGENTIPNNLTNSNYVWSLNDGDNTILGYGFNSDVELGCSSYYDEDSNEWTDCIDDHEIQLAVTCGNYTSYDTITVSIFEENNPPNAGLTTNLDSLIIPNSTGIPGNDMSVSLFTYIDVGGSSEPDDDIRTFLWYDENYESVNPVVVNNESDYIYYLHVKDPYGAYGETNLVLNLDEYNDIPYVEIAVQNIDEVGQDQVIPENEEIFLYGIIVDSTNDIDGTETPNISEDDIEYHWTCLIDDIEIDDPQFDSHALNTSFIAPNVIQGETKEIICYLEAIDPFQSLGYDIEESISNPITIEIINTNNPPIINAVAGSNYFIMEDDSSQSISLNFLLSNGYIEIFDEDGDSDFSFLIYGNTNYSLFNNMIIPNQNFNGELYIPIQIDDGQTTSNGDPFNSLSDTLDLLIDVIPVNDLPYFESQDTLVTEESQNAVIDFIEVFDIDNYNSNIKFEINVSYGNLELASTVNFNWEVCDEMNPNECTGLIDSSAIFNTSISSFNNAINGAIYFPSEDNEENIPGELLILVDDLGNVGGSEDEGLIAEDITTIMTSAVNDPPNIIIPVIGENEVFEDEEYILSDIELSDVDVGDNPMHLIIDPINGYVSVTEEFQSHPDIVYIHGDGLLDDYLSIEATINNLQLAIESLSFISNENFSGLASINFSLNDLGFSGSGGEQIVNQSLSFYVYAINDEPNISYPEIDLVGTEDEIYYLSGISIDDIDVNDATDEEGDEIQGNLEVTIKCNECNLSFSSTDNLNFVDGENNSSSMVFTGNLNNINTALTSLTYITENSYNGTDNIFIKVSDLGNYSSFASETAKLDSVTLPIILSPINDPPVNQTEIGGIDSPPTLEAIQEDYGLVLYSTTGIWNDNFDNNYSEIDSEIIFTYQWQRADNNFGTGLINIPGENGESYIITGFDSEKYIRVQIIATDNGIGLPESQSAEAFSEYYHISNLPPIANSGGTSDEYPINEDEQLIVTVPGVLVNDIDPDGDEISAELVSSPSHGTLLNSGLLATGDFIYEPNLNFVGTDYFSYMACDETNLCSNETFVTIYIEHLNDAPSFDFIGDVESGINQGQQIVNWAYNIDDGDPEIPQGLAFNILEIQYLDIDSLFTESGSPFITEDGILTYEAIQDASGTAIITINLEDDGYYTIGTEEIYDEQQVSDEITFSISIIPYNYPPSFIISESLQYIERIEDQGEVNPSFPDFALDIQDGDSTEQFLTFIVSENDNEALFDNLFINNSGTLIFEINENMSGIANIGIQLEDFASGMFPENNYSDTLEFIINILPINDHPLFQVGVDAQVLEDSNNTGIHSFDFWAQEIDDGDPEIVQNLTFEVSNYNSIFYNEPPTVSPSGTLSFETADNLYGVDENITIKLVDDGLGPDSGSEDENESPLQTFSISILSVNDPPVFIFNGPSNLVILEDNFDSDSLGVQLLDPPLFETNLGVIWTIFPEVALNELGQEFALISIEPTNGIVTILPVENANGQAEFTITATDQEGDENDGINHFSDTFILDILPLNDPPLLANNENIPYIIGSEFYVGDILNIFNSDSLWSDTTDTDFSGESQIIEYKYQFQRGENIDDENPQNINLVPSQDSTYILTELDAHKFIRVNIYIYDNGVGETVGNSNLLIYTTEYIEVLNSYPNAVNKEYTTQEDHTIFTSSPGVMSNDYDIDGDEIFAHIVEGGDASHGTLNLLSDGSFTYLPNFNYNGTDFFYYYVEDQSGSSSNPALVNLIVSPINDPPVFTINESVLGGSTIDSIYALEDFSKLIYAFCLTDEELVPYDELEQEVIFSIEPNAVNFANIFLNSSTGEIIISSIPDQFGEEEFTIIASDDGGELLGGVTTYELPLHIEIQPVNDIPIFNIFSGADTIVIIEDFGNYQELCVSDISYGPENENQSLTFNINTDNNKIFDQSPFISTNDGQLYFRIGTNLNTGTVDTLITMTISLSDNGDNLDGGQNETENHFIYLRVRPVNDVPSFILGNNIILDENDDLDFDTTYVNWFSNISAGPIDEINQELYFVIDKEDDIDLNILQGIPIADENSGNLSFMLSPNYNGISSYSIRLFDDGGTGVNNEGDDESESEPFTIYVRQINDTPDSLIIFSDLELYAKDATTFHESDTDTIYFRLPYQDFASNNQVHEDLRFSWKKNDNIDIDTNPIINLDTLYTSFYRLELVNQEDNSTMVLFDYIKDEIEYNENLNSSLDSFYVDIDLSQSFPIYNAEYNYMDSTIFNNLAYIDTSGNTAYSWRVVTQNYSRDYLGGDPARVSDWSSNEFLVDFILPEVNFSYLINDMFPEYYDIYMETSETAIDSTARLITLYDSGSSELLYPQELWDETYHISSTFLDTGITSYSFQIRDFSENIGETLDSVYFQIINPSTNTSFYWPDNIASLDISNNTVSSSANLVLYSDNNSQSSYRLDDSKISKNYHIVPYAIEFANAIKILFNINLELYNDSKNIYIMKETDVGWVPVHTNIYNNAIIAWISEGGVYSLFYSEDSFEITPEIFEIVNIYPNPFNPITNIDFSVPTKSNIKIDVYNVGGQKIITLLNEELDAGFHNVQWPGIDTGNNAVATGIYLISIQYNEEIITTKVTLLK